MVANSLKCWVTRYAFVILLALKPNTPFILLKNSYWIRSSYIHSNHSWFNHRVASGGGCPATVQTSHRWALQGADSAPRGTALPLLGRHLRQCPGGDPGGEIPGGLGERHDKVLKGHDKVLKNGQSSECWGIKGGSYDKWGAIRCVIVMNIMINGQKTWWLVVNWWLRWLVDA